MENTAKTYEAETWEQRRDRERAENAVTRKETRKKLAQVFKLAGFAIVPEKDDADNFNATTFAKATHEDMTLHAHANGYGEKGRVRFSVSYPAPKTGERPYDRDWPKPEASCTLAKTPEQLAGEILRRIMPQYREGMVLARKANAQTEQYQSSRNINLRSILDRELTAQEEKEGRSRIDGASNDRAWGSVQAFDESVNLELHGLTVAQAVAIMRIVRA